MTISTGHCGVSRERASKRLKGLSLLIAALLLTGCEKEPRITVRDEVKSPDGTWTVQTQYENWAGPGNNFQDTRVVIFQTGIDKEPQPILSFDDDVNNIVITWRDNHHLELVYRKGPKVTFQVVRFSDIDISAIGETV